MQLAGRCCSAAHAVHAGLHRERRAVRRGPGSHLLSVGRRRPQVQDIERRQEEEKERMEAKRKDEAHAEAVLREKASRQRAAADAKEAQVAPARRHAPHNWRRAAASPACRMQGGRAASAPQAPCTTAPEIVRATAPAVRGAASPVAVAEDRARNSCVPRQDLKIQEPEQHACCATEAGSLPRTQAPDAWGVTTMTDL